MSIRYKKTIKTKMLFFIASLIMALSAMAAPFSLAEEGNMEEQPLIAKAGLDTPGEAAILAAPDTGDVVSSTLVKLSPDTANLFNSGGFKIARNQTDSAGAEEEEFSHLNVSALEYKAKSIDLKEILPSISTISSDDKKILGVVLPPFVYLGKTF
ncbi:MAG: hypothetical protein RIG61_01970 [Deltaproteobacteria bacterium]